MHKIKGGETFHLVAIQPPVRGIVDLFNIGLVAECRILGKPCNGSLRTIVSFAREEHGKERVRGHGLRSGAGKTFPESLYHAMQFHTVH